MNLWPTAADLVGLPGLPGTRRGIQLVGDREGWVRRTEPVRGGQVIRYAVESLPAVTRLALAARNVHAESAQIELRPGALQAVSAQVAIKANREALDQRAGRIAGTARAANVSGKRALERDDKLRLLVLLQRYWGTLGGALCPAVEAFCLAWNSGQIDAPLALRARWPELPRWRTVLEWHMAVERHGGDGVVRRDAHNLGRSAVLEGELGEIVLALLHEYPHVGSAPLRNMVAKILRDTSSLPSERAFQYAIKRWKAENSQLFSSITNPDQWRHRYMSAAGSRSENVEGPNDLWELDGTNAELMLSDGKRWTLTAVVDVGTRDLLVRLSSSPRAAVVMGLTRQALATWGVPRRYKTDNGSDYTANQLELGLSQLGINHELCDPFQPQQKPHIERAIGSLLHGLFEWLPGYLGHNVAQRQDIEARKSFADRLMKKERGVTPDPVDLRLSPDALQSIIDNWLEDYRNREHGGDSMLGRSPNQVRAQSTASVYMIDDRALDIFLAPASKLGIRTVQNKGLRLDDGWYNCGELGGLEGTEVQVKQSEADIGICYVFGLGGHYIGTAIDHSRLGTSAAEVAAARREHQKRALHEQRAALKAIVRAVKPQQLVMEALTRKREAAIDASPTVTRLRPSKAHTSEAIDSLLRTPAAMPPTLSAAAQQTLQRMESDQAEAQRPAAAVLDMLKPPHRYARAVRLRQRLDAGTEAVDARDLQWLEGYVRTSEFKGLDRLYQGSDPLAAEGGG